MIVAPEAFPMFKDHFSSIGSQEWLVDGAQLFTTWAVLVLLPPGSRKTFHSSWTGVFFFNQIFTEFRFMITNLKRHVRKGEMYKDEYSQGFLKAARCGSVGAWAVITSTAPFCANSKALVNSCYDFWKLFTYFILFYFTWYSWRQTWVFWTLFPATCQSIHF